MGQPAVQAQAMLAAQIIQDDPRSFAQGEVISRTPDGVVLRSPEAMRAVRITPSTVVWKESDTDPGAIQLGDWIDVRGTPLADGTLEATSGSLWVNISRRDGAVKEVLPGALVLEHARGVETIELSSKLEVVDIRNGTQQVAPDGISVLKPGMNVGCVGVRVDGGKTFRATRIWTTELS